MKLKNIMRKILIVLCLVIGFILYSVTKKDKLYYIPFDIPGKQMAATVPPFGIFIESKYRKDDEMLRHELAHWGQYKRMGLYGFYSTYFSEYKKYGRFDGPMEVEARKLSKVKCKNLHICVE
jgi:hypothetical protein